MWFVSFLKQKRGDEILVGIAIAFVRLTLLEKFKPE